MGKQKRSADALQNAMNQKRKTKSKEDIVQEAKDKSELRDLQQFASTSIMPVLIKYNQTAYQAAQVLEVMKQVSFGKMNRSWNDKKFSEIGLKEELALDVDAQNSDMYGEIIDAFADMPIAKVTKLLDVLTRVIDAYANRQVMQVRVADLPLEEMMK